jgi:pyruvate kinase
VTAAGTPPASWVAVIQQGARSTSQNKGPYIDRAVVFLADVLERMQEHQDKKGARLRRLSVAGNSSIG